MALPTEPTQRQEDIIDLMLDGSPSMVVELINKNPRRLGRFFRRLDREFNTEDFVGALSSNNYEIENACRIYMEKCISQYGDKIPQYFLSKPQDYKKFLKDRALKQDRRTIKLALVESAGRALRGSIPSTLNIPVQGLALGLNLLGINRAARNIGGLGFTAASIAGAFMSLSASINDSQAAIPNNADLNSASSPLNLTITAPNPSNNHLAYTTDISKKFGALSRAIDNIIGDTNDLDTPTFDSPYLLSPYLLKKMQTDSQTRLYAEWCFDAALKHNIDPVIFTNQMFRESKHFSPDVISGKELSAKGALGIAQFLPSTAEIYGLTEEDLTSDPQKALDGAAKMMAEKTIQYGGDQLVALAAYNGGDEAVNWVKRELGKDHITHQEWIAFMEDRREKVPTNKAHAYQNETYKYIMDISNEGWDNKYTSWARKLTDSTLPQRLADILGIEIKLESIEQTSMILPDGEDLPIPTPSPRGLHNG